MKNLFRTLLVGLGLTTTTAVMAAQESDTFQTPGGKTVVIHHIKHASIHFEFEGLHIYADPVGTVIEPKTDVSLLPKANIILLTHESACHCRLCQSFGQCKGASGTGHAQWRQHNFL